MKLMTAIFLAAMATTVQAAQIPVTVDFNAPDPFKGFSFNNECSDGPDDRTWPGPTDGTWWTTKFCPHDSGLEPQVHITRGDGRPFTLLGFDSPQVMRVRSSRGGQVFTDEHTCDPFLEPDCFTTDMTGPLFHQVQWITMCPWCLPDDIDEHAIGMIDNLRFSVQVPAPAPLTLIAIALVGLAFIRRRAMSIA